MNPKLYSCFELNSMTNLQTKVVIYFGIAKHSRWKIENRRRSMSVWSENALFLLCNFALPSLFLRTKLDEPSLFPSKNGNFIEFGSESQRTYMGGTWKELTFFTWCNHSASWFFFRFYTSNLFFLFFFEYFCTWKSETCASLCVNLGLRRSFIKRRSNVRGCPMLIISEYVKIARCHSKDQRPCT